MRGGRRPGAGRPPGAKNRKTVEMQAAIEASEMTPLDYMISVMRNEDNDPRTRLEAAHHAAPYVHSKLTATELTVNKEPADVDALKARLKQLIASNPELLGDVDDVMGKVASEQPPVSTYVTPNSGDH